MASYQQEPTQIAHEFERPGLQHIMVNQPRNYPEGGYVGRGLLHDKVAVITGGDSGIGRAIALQYVKEGARVAILYHPSEEKDAKETFELMKQARKETLNAEMVGMRHSVDTQGTEGHHLHRQHQHHGVEQPHVEGQLEPGAHQHPRTGHTVDLPGTGGGAGGMHHTTTPSAVATTPGGGRAPPQQETVGATDQSATTGGRQAFSEGSGVGVGGGVGGGRVAGVPPVAHQQQQQCQQCSSGCACQPNCQCAPGCQCCNSNTQQQGQTTAQPQVAESRTAVNPDVWLLIVAADLSDPQQCRQAIQMIADKFHNRIDILVNNAAEQHMKECITDISPEHLESTFRTNIFSMFHLTKAVLPFMQDHQKTAFAERDRLKHEHNVPTEASLAGGAPMGGLQHEHEQRDLHPTTHQQQDTTPHKEEKKHGFTLKDVIPSAFRSKKTDDAPSSSSSSDDEQTRLQRQQQQHETPTHQTGGGVAHRAAERLHRHQQQRHKYFSGCTIINSTSVVAYQGSGKLLDYAATKGAIVSYTKSLAKQLAPMGIRVNAVAPGPVNTPLQPISRPQEDMDQFVKYETPLGNMAEPGDIAPTYVFLASHWASQYTGQVLHPNGGTAMATS